MTVQFKDIILKPIDLIPSASSRNSNPSPDHGQIRNAWSRQLGFCKTLMRISSTPALGRQRIRLMALTHTRLDKMHAFVSRMIRDNGVDATVTSTTDRREALGTRIMWW